MFVFYHHFIPSAQPRNLAQNIWKINTCWKNPKLMNLENILIVTKEEILNNPRDEIKKVEIL